MMKAKSEYMNILDDTPIFENTNMNTFIINIICTWIANYKQHSTWLELIVFHLSSHAKLHVNYVPNKHYCKTEVNWIKMFLIKI